MKNNKKFETPEIEVCRFSSEDVLTTSGPQPVMALGHYRQAWEVNLNTIDPENPDYAYEQ